MGIVDMMIQYGDEAATFTVNTAVDNVVVTTEAADGVLSLAGNFTKFAWKDSFNILSIGVLLPFGFEFYEYDNSVSSKYRPPYVDMELLKGSDKSPFGIIPSRVNLPFENYEMNLGAFIVPQDAIGESFHFAAHLPSTGNEILKISMVNVPAVFNAKVFHCPIFAKIEHTLILEA